ncbi:MAG: hypothetical protein LUC47_11580 [Clostridiales bacterium]|nr:hypothetical protein [Clostridiales bacterium]
MDIPAEILAMYPAPLEGSIANYPPYVVDDHTKAVHRYFDALEAWMQSAYPDCPFLN